MDRIMIFLQFIGLAVSLISVAWIVTAIFMFVMTVLHTRDRLERLEKRHDSYVGIVNERLNQFQVAGKRGKK